MKLNTIPCIGALHYSKSPPTDSDPHRQIDCRVQGTTSQEQKCQLFDIIFHGIGMVSICQRH